MSSTVSRTQQRGERGRLHLARVASSTDERGVGQLLPGNLTAESITPPSVELLVETSTDAPSVISRVRAIEERIRLNTPNASRTSTRSKLPCTDHTVDSRRIFTSASIVAPSRGAVHNITTVMGNGLINEEPLRSATRTTSSICITSGDNRDLQSLREKNKGVAQDRRIYNPPDRPPQKQLEIRPERVHGSTRDRTEVIDDAGPVRLPDARRAQQAIDGLRKGYPADAHYGLASNDQGGSTVEATASRATRPLQFPDSSPAGLERTQASTTNKRSADTALFTGVNAPRFTPLHFTSKRCPIPLCTVLLHTELGATIVLYSSVVSQVTALGHTLSGSPFWATGSPHLSFLGTPQNARTALACDTGKWGFQAQALFGFQTI